MPERASWEPPEELTAAELGLWQAYRNGSTYDLRTGDARHDDPFGEVRWGPERAVRARVVARLLLDGPPPLPGRAPALKLTGCYITGHLDLANSEITVPVELQQCRLEASLLLVDCRAGLVILHRCWAPRLEATRLTVEGDLRLNESRLARGLVLAQANIGTDLSLEGLELGGDRRGKALDADGMNIAQDVNADRLEATGELSLRGARVGGTMSLHGCRLSNPRGRWALTASRLTVEENLVVAPGALPSGSDSRLARMQSAAVQGGINLDSSTIGGALVLDGVRLKLADDQELSLRGIQATELTFTPECPERGRVDLQDTVVSRLVDRAASWPGDGRLRLRGFTYEYLIPKGPFPLDQRLAWVHEATPEFNPEPYDRLAACLQAGGEEADAHTVLLTKLRRRRETLHGPLRVWDYIQDLALGYGYRPGRAVLWLVLLLTGGSVWFAKNPPPALKPDEAPHWEPFIYTLDLLLPVLDLGQEAAWRTTGASQWIALTLVILGWLLATIVTAGAAAVILRRN
ncbi:oxidoreductase [Streptomyces oryzae]|uniref:Oxidoreductase n=1 Tax=Streptomyces oryzae TaxID=1434886 RepID=A0ABS3XK01_9ACTN|nr:oxidoreductase [Streptomyces oryzae]MBO8195646.1 oxidoreductase [Streptomyces oryzae]